MIIFILQFIMSRAISVNNVILIRYFMLFGVILIVFVVESGKRIKSFYILYIWCLK